MNRWRIESGSRASETAISELMSPHWYNFSKPPSKVCICCFRPICIFAEKQVGLSLADPFAHCGRGNTDFARENQPLAVGPRQQAWARTAWSVLAS